MNTDPAQLHCLPCPEAPDSRDSSPVPEIDGPEENYAPLRMSSAETPHTETGKRKLILERLISLRESEIWGGEGSFVSLVSNYSPLMKAGVLYQASRHLSQL